jgi:hypothetical protein
MARAFGFKESQEEVNPNALALTEGVELLTST